MKLNKYIHININKKISHRAILIALILLIAVIGCSIGIIKHNHDEKIKSQQTMIANKTAAYATDLKDSAALTTDEAIVDYLVNWSKNKDVSCTVDDYNNVIMHVSADKEFKQSKPTVIVCSYDSKSFDACIGSFALSLYMAKNSGKTGELTVIFAQNTGQSFDGIANIDSKYFKDNSNVFCLNGGSESFCSLNTGCSSSYQFTKSFETRKPKGSKAIKITIDGLPGGVPGLVPSSYPNPIKELGDMLASFKTNAYIFQLADFVGGTDAQTLPKSASTTIVINENDLKKFNEKLESISTKYNEKYQGKYPGTVFSYKEVKLPKKVLKTSDSDAFVSLLYTLLDGVYYKDDNDKLESTVNIGCVKESENEYTIYASGHSLDKSSIKEIDNTYKTICGLSNVEYAKTDSEDLWKGNEDSEMNTLFLNAYREYSGNSPDYLDTPASSAAPYVEKINDNCNIMVITLNENSVDNYAGAMVNFMINNRK